MSESAGPPELVTALLEPAVYPHTPATVELRETHISWVFLAGELAYKVKKPLVLPFLDYGTVKRRHEMCRAEVRLNRRLAPEIYLSTVGIASDGDRYRLTSEDDPAAIEYAVKMRRVEERRSVAALARSGGLAPEQIAATAALLARFHSEAAVVPRPRADVAVLEATLEENTATLRHAAGGLIDRTRLDAMERFIDAFYGARCGQLAERADRGRVRDCHGDLRAEHVIAPLKGPIYIYDCIEFNRELREIDVGADLAFLVMDLAALGAEALARRLAEEYRRAGGDPGDDRLLCFFAAYRAWVRAKVGCVRVGELAAGDAELARVEEEVGEMMRLGHRFAWRARGPLVLILCGVSAAGKTTVARAVAELSGWEHLSSDVTRKRRAGLDPSERGGPEIYTREQTLQTYRDLGQAAADRLRGGAGGVIVDATCHRKQERDAFRSGLGATPPPWFFVRCTASREVLAGRVRKRQIDPDRVSDADEAILDRQIAEFEPLEEVPRAERVDLEAEAPPDELATRIEGLLDASAWTSETGWARGPRG